MLELVDNLTSCRNLSRARVRVPQSSEPEFSRFVQINGPSKFFDRVGVVFGEGVCLPELLMGVRVIRIHVESSMELDDGFSLTASVG
jgi:hypothetical protein